MNNNMVKEEQDGRLKLAIEYLIKNSFAEEIMEGGEPFPGSVMVDWRALYRMCKAFEVWKGHLNEHA